MKESKHLFVSLRIGIVIVSRKSFTQFSCCNIYFHTLAYCFIFKRDYSKRSDCEPFIHHKTIKYIRAQRKYFPKLDNPIKVIDLWKLLYCHLRPITFSLHLLCIKIKNSCINKLLTLANEFFCEKPIRESI